MKYFVLRIFVIEMGNINSLYATDYPLNYRIRRFI